MTDVAAGSTDLFLNPAQVAIEVERPVIPLVLRGPLRGAGESSPCQLFARRGHEESAPATALVRGANEHSHDVPDLRWVVVFVFCWPELAESDDGAVVDQDQDTTAQLSPQGGVSRPVSMPGASDTDGGHVFGNVPDVRRHAGVCMDFSEIGCVRRFGGPDLHARMVPSATRSDVAFPLAIGDTPTEHRTVR